MYFLSEEKKTVNWGNFSLNKHLEEGYGENATLPGHEAAFG